MELEFEMEEAWVVVIIFAFKCLEGLNTTDDGIQCGGRPEKVGLISSSTRNHGSLRTNIIV